MDLFDLIVAICERLPEEKQDELIELVVKNINEEVKEI